MKADVASWRREPFTTGAPVPYSSSFSAEEFERLQSGLIPREMEDKWFIYYEAPYLFFHRSWTGQPVYRLKFAVQESGATVYEAELSADLARSSDQTVAYEALLIDFLINVLLLGKTMAFPCPDDLDGAMASVYQHHISGTACPIQPVAAKHSWWRRWIGAWRGQ